MLMAHSLSSQLGIDVVTSKKLVVYNRNVYTSNDVVLSTPTWIKAIHQLDDVSFAAIYADPVDMSRRCVAVLHQPICKTDLRVPGLGRRSSVNPLLLLSCHCCLGFFFSSLHCLW